MSISEFLKLLRHLPIAAVVSLSLAIQSVSAAEPELPMPPVAMQRAWKPLTGSWQLRSAFDSKGAEQEGWFPNGISPYVNFSNDGGYTVWACNFMTWRGVPKSGVIRVGEAGVTTMGGCDEELARLQPRAGALFSKNFQYRVKQDANGAVLTLTFADGSRWEMTPTPAPKAEK